MSLSQTLLFVSQVYPPDPTAVGQYMASAAEEMASRGYRVVVLTANRGYDDPRIKFPKREIRNGVEVVRFPFSSFGKQSILHRLLAQGSFCFQAFLRGLCVRGVKRILVTTSPPMGSLVGYMISRVRGVAVNHWVMDLNPDQAIAMGIVKPTSLMARLMERLNGLILRRAERVIALDRFMADRLEQKLPESREKIVILPPWPMEGVLERVEHAQNPFRQLHGLEDKFVVMYSGNHSLVHPLDSLLQAALRMADEPRVLFLFVGGGRGKEAVEAAIAQSGNDGRIRSLPYRPLEEIKYSLSAADLHVISMGDSMVGIVHPCKFYGTLLLGKPLLLLGPRKSHIGEVLQNHDCGWDFAHGEVDGLEAFLRSLPHLSKEELEQKSTNARKLALKEYSQEQLRGTFCDLLE